MLVAVLLGLTLTAVSRARDAARSTSCRANLKALIQAVSAYRNAHQDLFPVALEQVDVRIGRLDPLPALAPHLDAALPARVGGQTVTAPPWRCPADQTWGPSRGLSYWYVPTEDMVAIFGYRGAEAVQVEYARKIAGRPEETIWIDAGLFHRGPRARNAARADGGVESR